MKILFGPFFQLPDGSLHILGKRRLYVYIMSAGILKMHFKGMQGQALQDRLLFQLING